MKLEQAKAIAEEIKAALIPYCQRIEIAGSIRREKPKVGDIEIVCIPRRTLIEAVKLFAVNEKEVHPNFVSYIDSFEKIRGSATGKYACRKHPSGIKIDFFMAEPQNWGYIFAIRTGSADFSHNVLAKTWVAKGYRGSNGMLTKYGRPIPIYEESELFELLGLPLLKPEFRV